MLEFINNDIVVGYTWVTIGYCGRARARNCSHWVAAILAVAAIYCRARTVASCGFNRLGGQEVVFVITMAYILLLQLIYLHKIYLMLMKPPKPHSYDISMLVPAGCWLLDVGMRVPTVGRGVGVVGL